MQRNDFATLSLLAILAGCGGSTPAPAADANIPSSDAGTDTGPRPEDGGPRNDAFVPVDAPPACDVSPAPLGLAPLAGSFVVLAPDAGLPIPAQTGGDPTGVWRFDEITIYTGSGSAGMFDETTSTIDGTAWAVVEGDVLRIQLILDVALMGTVAGTVRRHTETSIRGTIVVDGATLVLTPECIDPAPTMSGGMSPMFTAEGTTGTIVLTTMGMAGINQIVLTGARTPT